MILVFFSFISHTAFYLGDRYLISLETVHGNSGAPNILEGDILLRDIYRSNDIRRSDLISVRLDARFNNKSISKRVIGFEGETIEIKNGSIYINGEKIQTEPIASVKYTLDSTCLFGLEPYTIPKGKLYVLGDNSEHSTDSRQLGPIDRSRIDGKYCKILWPLSRIRKLS